MNPSMCYSENQEEGQLSVTLWGQTDHSSWDWMMKGFLGSNDKGGPERLMNSGTWAVSMGGYLEKRQYAEDKELNVNFEGWEG